MRGYHHVVPYHVVGIRGCRETTYSYTTDERYEETGSGLSGNTCGFYKKEKKEEDNSNNIE